MKYMGSKRRLWKDIGPIILRDRKEGQYYVEPFCGGCNSISQVSNPRIASDLNPYLIALYKSLINGKPQIYPITREIYNQARQAYRESDFSKYSLSDMGWVGFMASFNGMFFGTYSGNGIKTKDGVRNYIDEGIRGTLKDIENLRGIEFIWSAYDKIEIPKNSIIYCDPPYRDTTSYTTGDFDYDKFYQWCKDMSNLGHKVFISEYYMPSEFNEIWAKEVKTHISIKKNNRIEKLFTI